MGKDRDLVGYEAGSRSRGGWLWLRWLLRGGVVVLGDG